MIQCFKVEFRYTIQTYINKIVLLTLCVHIITHGNKIFSQPKTLQIRILKLNTRQKAYQGMRKTKKYPIIKSEITKRNSNIILLKPISQEIRFSILWLLLLLSEVLRMLQAQFGIQLRFFV